MDDSTYGRNRFTEIDNQLASIREQISYIINLMKQNGFKDYEKEAAYKANLALAKEINAKWADEMAKVLNAKREEDFRKSQDNSKSE